MKAKDIVMIAVGGFAVYYIAKQFKVLPSQVSPKDLKIEKIPDNPKEGEILDTTPRDNNNPFILPTRSLR